MRFSDHKQVDYDNIFDFTFLPQEYIDNQIISKLYTEIHLKKNSDIKDSWRKLLQIKGVNRQYQSVDPVIRKAFKDVLTSLNSQVFHQYIALPSSPLFSQHLKKIVLH